MTSDVEVLYEVSTAFDYYRVVDMTYNLRRARVLFSGSPGTPQSGIPKDKRPDLLFDYNQRFFELANGLKPGRILLIGGGAYTLPSALLVALPQVHIDVVERDPGLKDIAAKYFGLKPDSRLNIIHGDGREYIDKSKHKYDLIFIDAFAHEVPAKSLQTKEATIKLKSMLTPNGTIAANLVSAYIGSHSSNLRHQFTAFADQFEIVEVTPASGGHGLWISQNLVVVAQSSGATLARQLLRFRPVPPPNITPTDLLRDTD
jgi:hypothetical protein